MNYGGNLHNTLENLMMMSAAEDQDIVLEQIANKDNRILDHQFFVPGGGPHPLSREDMILVVGQEYRPPFWGHVFMFGLRDHLISPFTTGYEGTAIESLYPSNTDMFRKAKAQGAYVGYVHAYAGERDPLEADLGGAKGAVVDAALGYYRCDRVVRGLARGFCADVCAVEQRPEGDGGRRRRFDQQPAHEQACRLSAHVRVYRRARAEHAGVARRHAFRPRVRDKRAMVELSVNGSLPGETVNIAASGGGVEVHAQVRSIVPLQKVTLYFNGQPAEDIPLSTDRRSADLRKTLKVERSGWYHVRAEGAPADRFPLDTGYPQGFTNPVWVIAGDQPVRDRAAADYALRWIDKLQQLAEAWPGWRSPQEKNHVYAQFEEARQVYRRLGREDRR